MKKYRAVSVLLALVLSLSLFPALPASALEEPEITARNAILVDANYGEVLFEKGGYEKVYPASVTKVMTALLTCEAIERGELSTSQIITASPTSQEGLHPNGSNAKPRIQAGEEMSVEDLLYCLMLPSANEAANILAEAVAGDVATFVELMNRRAAQLGCSGTHFVNPHGLHDDDHYTTPYDIYLILKAAMELPLFRTVTYTSVHKVPPTNIYSKERELYNTNALVSQWQYRGYRYEPCIGGKTGTTDEAGACLASAAVDGDEYLICVVMGASSVPRGDGTSDLRQFSESSALFKWGFANFRRTTISRAEEPVAQVNVTLSQQADYVMVKPVGEFSRTLPVDMDLDEIVATPSLFQDTVEAPVEEGQVLGTMTLSYQGEVYGVLDLVAINSVERSEFLYRQAQIESFFHQYGARLLLAAVLLLLVVVILRVMVFQKRRPPVAANRGRYSGKRRR